jgi:hypothetical protein
MRAKQALLDRNLRGGLSGLFCNGLEAYLNELDKIPLSFEATFRRAVGREPRLEDRWDCYGGRESDGGRSIFGISQRFTLTELEQHCMKGRWDRRTAELRRDQQAIWLKTGDKFYANSPIYPPGWAEVSQVATPPPVQAAGEDPDPDYRECDCTGAACKRKSECDAAGRCLELDIE